MNTASKQILTLKQASLIPTISNMVYHNISYQFCGCLIYGDEDHFNHSDGSKGIRNHTEKMLLSNRVWAHKPHTKNRKIKKSILIAHMGLWITSIALILRKIKT